MLVTGTGILGRCTTTPNSGLVFTKPDGSGIHPAAVLGVVRPACQGGLRAGVDTKVMSERLGHANVAITQDLYQHVLKEMDESAAVSVAAVILGIC